MTLGGGRSILLSYRGLFIFIVLTIRFLGKGERHSVTLGGERSILLSYGGIYEKQEIFYSKSPGLSSVSRGFLAVGSAEKGVERADKVEPGDGAVQVIAV